MNRDGLGWTDAPAHRKARIEGCKYGHRCRSPLCPVDHKTMIQHMWFTDQPTCNNLEMRELYYKQEAIRLGTMEVGRGWTLDEIMSLSPLPKPLSLGEGNPSKSEIEQLDARLSELEETEDEMKALGLLAKAVECDLKFVTNSNARMYDKRKVTKLRTTGRQVRTTRHRLKSIRK